MDISDLLSYCAGRFPGRLVGIHAGAVVFPGGGGEIEWRVDLHEGMRSPDGGWATIGVRGSSAIDVFEQLRTLHAWPAPREAGDRA